MFSLFSKKKEKGPDVMDIMDRRLLELEKKFPVGSRFSYLGAECLVTNTFTLGEQIVSVGRHLPVSIVSITTPALIADYADKNGVIRELKLSYDEAMRINN